MRASDHNRHRRNRMIALMMIGYNIRHVEKATWPDPVGWFWCGPQYQQWFGPFKLKRECLDAMFQAHEIVTRDKAILALLPK